jgi:hypothetical protein
MDEIGDYTATVEKNLLNGEWVIRVRYVAALTMGGRKQYASFVLVPAHQGMMFFAACDQIEPALQAHMHKGGTLDVSHV